MQSAYAWLTLVDILQRNSDIIDLRQENLLKLLSHV